MSHRFVHALLLLCFSHAASGDENSKSTVARKPVKLPGMVIDLEQRCLDLEARSCLDNGFLELLACSAGTKEHESVLAVSAMPMHIHTGLLLLGADNGHPAMTKPVYQDKTHWIDVPPRGGTDSVTRIWPDHTLMDLTRYEALNMIVKAIDDEDYLFIEAGGFYDRHPPEWTTQFVVLKRM